MDLMLIGGYFAAINLTTFLAFRADKRRAESGQWRIPEARLLTMAFCGGWFGAKLAQRRYRHKTRKQPFCRMLGCIPVAWVGMALVLVALVAFPQMPRLLVSTFFPDEQATEYQRTTPKFFKRVNH